MKKNTLIVSMSCALIGLSTSAFAEQEIENFEKIEVKGSLNDRLKNAGRLKDTLKKTEVVSREDITNKNATSVADSIENETGVRVNNECSMCGVKRVMIDGMKGEHSTVLIDGIPIFSYIAGFYGVDALPTASIENIDIARGPGSSLASPEAIGGTINIMTLDPRENVASVDMSVGNDGFHNISVGAAVVSDDGRSRGFVAIQDSNEDQWDEDKNGVNESPQLGNQSMVFKFIQDIGQHDTVSLYYQNLDSEVFGGPMLGKLINHPSEALNMNDGCDWAFEGNDVNNLYTGNPCGTTESIKTEMDAGIFKWTHEFSPNTHMDFSLARADMTQDSFYEGEDYFAEDELSYLDVRLHHQLNQNHFFTFGIDAKKEKMRSSSIVAAPLDSFDNDTTGFFFQDEWMPNYNTEIAMAVRVDRLETDFVNTGNAFSETMVSPRLHIRYDHNSALISRLAVGRGYRVPLSFFEADHGILADGFAVDVDEIEKSTGINYAMSYDNEKLTATASVGWSEVENLAFIDTDRPIPTLVNSSEKGSVFTSDITVGYALTDSVNVTAGLENFNYDSNYKSTFGVAPIETRGKLELDADFAEFELYTRLTGIGQRDLTDYGYVDVYNDAALTDPKGDRAEAFWLLDFQLSYALNDHWKLYVGANNLLNYTQTGEVESPLFFDADAEYDVGHIWGPLRGRQLYLGFRWEL